MFKSLLIVLFCFSSFATELEFRIVSSSSSQLYLKDGAEHFIKLVNNSCSLNLTSKFSFIEYTSPSFNNFDDYKTTVTLKDGIKFPFMYYQEELWNLVQAPELKHRPKTIDIIEVESLERHCGFAFPTVQFTKDQNELIVNELQNRILISKKRMNCGNINRLIAHELAHITIQDNPAHFCTVNGSITKCPSNNLLSDLVYPPGTNPNIPYFDENPKMIVSSGVNITKEQCKNISDTIDQLP